MRVKELKDNGGESKILSPMLSGFRGKVTVVGSKSIANRAILMGTLTGKALEIENVPLVENSNNDINIAIQAVKNLGVPMNIMNSPAITHGPRTVSLKFGAARDNFLEQHKPQELFLANAGSVLRPLTAILAAGRGVFFLTGDRYMCQRPIGDLVESLAKHGVEISCHQNNYPPIKIRANGLTGGRIAISASKSSQYLSALLMAAPLAQGELSIIVRDQLSSGGYVDLTLKMMKDFGISVENDGYQRFLIRPQPYCIPPNGRYYVEGDASSASYFFAAGALPNSMVSVAGIHQNSLQPDIGFLRILQEMGAVVDFAENEITVSAPKNQSALKGIDVDMNRMPDSAVTLAVLALFAEGTTVIRNIAHLQHKESQRLSGLFNELSKSGATIKMGSSWLSIAPSKKIKNLLPACLEIETYGDHRIAMAFSLLSHATKVIIKKPNCVAKSYEGFFKDFQGLQ